MIIDIKNAIHSLQNGEIVAIPTETVYGLAAPYLNQEALKKVFETKKRPLFDPLIVHIGHENQIKKVVSQWPKSAAALAQKFWPGPLTIILKKHAEVSSLITAGGNFVGLRMPSHPMALELLQQTGPLAAPSANRFGKTSPTLAQHVVAEYKGKVPVLDGGACEVGIESTVVKIEETDSQVLLTIVRPGIINEDMLYGALSESRKTIHIQVAGSKDSPGQLKNHYQPDCPLVLSDNGLSWTREIHKDICKSLKIDPDQEPAFWQFYETNPTMIARTLYSDLHEKAYEAGRKSYVFLTLPKSYYKPNWMAIRDRLDKACSLKVKVTDDLPRIFVKNLAD